MTDTIETLDDVRVPNSIIEAGVRGRLIRINQRGATMSGGLRVNVGNSRTRREFEIGTVPLLRAAWLDMETLYEITDAGAYGMRLEDPKDSKVDQSSGVVVGLTATTFQLHERKLHAASLRFHSRKITRPRAATVAMYAGGVAVPFVLDQTTGIATIASGPDPDDVTWAGRFDVPVHFQNDAIDWEMVAAHQNPDARYLAGPSVVFEEILE